MWTYGYDTENRLISATNAATSTTATYAYDALDRRLSKTVNGVTTAWASYGNQEIAEYVGSGTVNLTRRFVYGAGIDEPLASVDVANARTYQFQDALGSVIALANGSGLVTEKYAYTAFGQTVTTGTPTAAYRYTGRRYDDETGLYFYRARAYSSSLGRFLQTDPIGTRGGINLYNYVGNDPINRLDPTGECPTCAVGAAIGGFVAGSYYLYTTDNPSFGGFLSSTAEGAIVGGLAGSGIGLGTLSIYGGAAHTAGQLGTAVADGNLDRYGSTYSSYLGRQAADFALGAAGTWVGGKVGELAGDALSSFGAVIGNRALSGAAYDSTVANLWRYGPSVAQYGQEVLNGYGTSFGFDLIDQSLSDQYSSAQK